MLAPFSTQGNLEEFTLEQPWSMMHIASL